MATKIGRTAVLSVAALAAAAMFVLPTAARADDASAALFKAKCAGCHGGDAKGETTMGKTLKLRDLASADVQKQSDADLTALISAGRNKMPPYGKSLSADQIKGLVGYVRSLAKK